jgi:hypothetical protein
MQKLCEAARNIEFNAGHFARYQGFAFNPNAPIEWREGWRKADRELKRPAWL